MCRSHFGPWTWNSAQTQTEAWDTPIKSSDLNLLNLGIYFKSENFFEIHISEPSTGKHRSERLIA